MRRGRVSCKEDEVFLPRLLSTVGGLEAGEMSRPGLTRECSGTVGGRTGRDPPVGTRVITREIECVLRGQRVWGSSFRRTMIRGRL